MNPTPDTLTPLLHDVFRQVGAALPPEIADRLRCARRTTRHGTRSSVLVSALWDRGIKSAVVDPRYFKYEYVHDPEHFYSGGSDWYLQFYFNPNRIYQNPQEFVGRLEPALQSLRIPGFEWHRRPNWIGLIHRFNLPYDPARLTGYLVPRYARLIQAVHPILMPLIDSFQEIRSVEERMAVISGRHPLRVRNVVTTEGSTELSRSIPRQMRQQVLSAYAHRCARCHRTPEASGSPLDLDHAKPVCRGGLTRAENLQPLCKTCHQWKGTRTVRFKPPTS